MRKSRAVAHLVLIALVGMTTSCMNLYRQGSSNLPFTPAIQELGRKGFFERQDDLMETAITVTTEIDRDPNYTAEMVILPARGFGDLKSRGRYPFARATHDPTKKIYWADPITGVVGDPGQYFEKNNPFLEISGEALRGIIMPGRTYVSTSPPNPQQSQ